MWGLGRRPVVADFTYVPMATGRLAYTAFVVDAFPNRIVGWECSTSKETAFVESAIREVVPLRARDGHPIDGAVHHSAGSQAAKVSDYAAGPAASRASGRQCRVQPGDEPP